MAESDNRSYYWRFLIYPDSTPENWRQILDNTQVEIAISPLHEPDEENLKQHYHGIVHFDTLKSQKQVMELITKPLNTVIPLIAASPKRSYEYLVHINHPEKQQFEKGLEAIEHYNGANKNTFCKVEESDDEHIKIIMYIQDNNICEMRDLTNYCLGNEIEWLSLIRKSCTYYNTLLTSNRAFLKECQAHERK